MSKVYNNMKKENAYFVKLQISEVDVQKWVCNWYKENKYGRIQVAVATFLYYLLPISILAIFLWGDLVIGVIASFPILIGLAFGGGLHPISKWRKRFIYGWMKYNRRKIEVLTSNQVLEIDDVGVKSSNHEEELWLPWKNISNVNILDGLLAIDSPSGLFCLVPSVAFNSSEEFDSFVSYAQAKKEEHESK